MRALKYLVVSVGIVVVALLGVSAAFLLTFEPNDYRGLVADALSRALEREVRISGDLELAPALVPTLAVNGVTIANPPWATRPTFASVGRLEGTIALLPLLEGEVQIGSVVFERVDMLLERDAERRGNWEFVFLTNAAAAEQTVRQYRTEVSEIELREIDVRYIDSGGTDLATHIERITLRRLPSRSFAIEGSGTFYDLPVRVEWRAGPLDAGAADPELRWPVAGTVTIDDAVVTIGGRLRAPLAYTRSELEWQVTDAGNALGALLGARWSDSPTYSLEGRVRIDADSVLVENLSGSVGTNPLFENARLDGGRVRLARGERIEAALAGEVSGRPFDLSARLGRLAEILEAAEPWPLDMTLKLGRAQATLATMLALGPGRVALGELRVGASGMEITGNAAATYGTARPHLAADLRSTTVDVTPLLSRSGAPNARSVLDRDFPLDWLDALDASVELEIGELRGLPVRVRGAEVSAQLGRGVLALTVAEAEVAGLDVAGRAGLRQVRGGAQIEIDLSSPRVDLQNALRAVAAENVSGFSATADAVTLALETRGSSIRSAVAATRATLLAGPVALGFSGASPTFDATLSTLRIGVDSGAAVEIEASGEFLRRRAAQDVGAPFTLAATGGTLAELLTARRLWPVLDLSVESRWREAPVRIAGRIADTRALLSREATGVHFDGTWGPLRASVEGSIAPVAGLVGTSVDVALATDDLAAAGRLLDLPELPMGEASLAGHALLGDRQWDLMDLAARAPGVAGGGSVSVSLAGRPTARGRLDFAALDLTPYTGSVGAPPPAAAPAAPVAGPVAGSASLRGAVAFYRLLSLEPFVLEPLRRGDLRLELGADVLRFGAYVSDAVRVSLSADAGVVGLDAVVDGGRASASVRLDARTDEPDLSARLSAAGIALAADRSGEPAAGTPVIDIEANLAGRGGSTQALAQSLDGDLLMYVRGGRIQTSGLRFFFGSVLYQLLDVINPFSARSPYVDIDCAGAYFDVADGVISTKNGIVVQTPQVQIVGLGNMSLTTGELAMQFRTKRRSGVVSIGGFVNEFVELTGTLDAPRVTVSPRRAARTGILAVVTGGLSVLATGLFERITAKDACPELPSLVGAPGASDR